MLRSFILVLLYTVSLPCWAQTKPGDQPKNLRVLPPWTMRLCPTELYATYDTVGALDLKKKDNDCALWRDTAPLLQQQIEDYKKLTDKNNQIVESYKKSQLADQTRINDLVKQLKDEIAEKNKYKYKPNYNWVYIAVGATVAAVGIAFGVGVWVAKN